MKYIHYVHQNINKDVKPVLNFKSMTNFIIRDKFNKSKANTIASIFTILLVLFTSLFSLTNSGAFDYNFDLNSSIDKIQLENNGSHHASHNNSSPNQPLIEEEMEEEVNLNEINFLTLSNSEFIKLENIYNHFDSSAFSGYSEPPYRPPTLS